MKRVCIISPGILPVPATRGGAIETLIMSLVKRNEIEQRMNLTVVSIDDREAREIARQYPHTVFRFIAPASKLPNTIYHYAQAVWKRVNRHSHVVASLYYRAALHAIRGDDFDVVVFEGGESRGFTAYDRVFRGKLWYHVHANPAPKTESAYFNEVMILSDFVKDRWRQSCTDKRQCLHTVHNGVDTALFERSLELDAGQSKRKLGYDVDDFVVMYCGRVSPEKGVKQLVDAIAAIDDPLVKLMVIGYAHDPASERYLAELKQRAKSMDGRVAFAGYVPNDQLDVYYAAADVQVVPSQWEEGAGNVCIEGMAAGKSIIASNCGGIPEYVSPDCAILVDRGNTMPAGIAAAITALRDDPERRRKMGEAGQRCAARYTEQAYYERYVQLIEQESNHDV